MQVALRYINCLYTVYIVYAVYTVYTVYTDPKTVMGSKFDQETAEKIALKFIARPDLANCMFIS